jgi:hypothetical protein
MDRMEDMSANESSIKSADRDTSSMISPWVTLSRISGLSAKRLRMSDGEGWG